MGREQNSQTEESIQPGLVFSREFAESALCMTPTGVSATPQALATYKTVRKTKAQGRYTMLDIPDHARHSFNDKFDSIMEELKANGHDDRRTSELLQDLWNLIGSPAGRYADDKPACLREIATVVAHLAVLALPFCCVLENCDWPGL